MFLSKKYKALIIVLLAILVAICFVSLFLGSEIISPTIVWNGILNNSEPKYNFIVQEIRLPRILTSLITGVALSVAGLQMQTYFRNGLAGPYILGISAGSGLGVAILIMSGALMGLDLTANGVSVTAAAIVGAFIILLLILLLSRKIGSGIMLLIIGIMLGSFISATISILEYFTDAESMKKYVLWTMGSTSGTNYNDLLVMSVSVFIGLIISFFSIRSLNSLLLGEDYARSMGFSLKKVRLLLILSTGILAGVVTAYCGPIAFIGLAVPHIVKIVIRTSDHRIVLPIVMLTGAITMVFCDMLAEMPGIELRLPINAVTSIIGAPIVIFVILKNKVVSNG